MGAWSETVPLDHSKFKDIPDAVRDVRTDLGDRLASLIYGFTVGEGTTPYGLKIGRLLTTGTGAGSTPPGTGSSASVDIYARGNGTASAVELWAIDDDGNDIQLTKGGKIPLDLSARLANNGWLIGRNYADAANVNIVKVNTANAIELASHPYAPDTGPSASLQYAPKGYVDNKFPVDLATPGTGITGVLPIANGGMGSVYDSGWFAVASNTTYTKTHSLGTTKVISTLYFSKSSDGSDDCVIMGGAHNDIGIGGRQANIVNLTTTTVQIRTATNITDYKDSDGTNQDLTSGYLRIIMLALA